MSRERITAVGETAALLLSKDVLDKLGIAIGDEVELSLIDRTLMLQPLDEAARGQQLAAITTRVFARVRVLITPTGARARIEEVALLFLRAHEVFALQARAIEEFGGLHGVCDAGALEAALTAVENRCVLRTSNSHHLCRDVCLSSDTKPIAFLDGNKRVAAAVAEIFLELNGAELRTTNEEIVALFLAIAAGQVPRQDVGPVVRAARRLHTGALCIGGTGMSKRGWSGILSRTTPGS